MLLYLSIAHYTKNARYHRQKNKSHGLPWLHLYRQCDYEIQVPGLTRGHRSGQGSYPLQALQPSPLQGPSTLRPLLFSTGQTAYPIRPYRAPTPVPYLSQSRISYLSYTTLGPGFAPHKLGRACNAPRAFTCSVVTRPHLSRAFVPRFVSGFCRILAMAVFCRTPPHLRDDFTELHTGAYPRMSELRRRPSGRYPVIQRLGYPVCRAMQPDTVPPLRHGAVRTKQASSPLPPWTSESYWRSR